jgi:hypothetical protein
LILLVTKDLRLSSFINFSLLLNALLFIELSLFGVLVAAQSPGILAVKMATLVPQISSFEA